VGLELARRIAYNSRNNERLRSWGRILALSIVVMGGLDLVSTNAALASGQLEGNPLCCWSRTISTWRAGRSRPGPVHPNGHHHSGRRHHLGVKRVAHVSDGANS
jgi:hypothetical protein